MVQRRDGNLERPQDKDDRPGNGHFKADRVKQDREVSGDKAPDKDKNHHTRISGYAINGNG
jgi:hypothetical protein